MLILRRFERPLEKGYRRCLAEDLVLIGIKQVGLLSKKEVWIYLSRIWGKDRGYKVMMVD
jgi:hypothetical protein